MTAEGITWRWFWFACGYAAGQILLIVGMYLERP